MGMITEGDVQQLLPTLSSELPHTDRATAKICPTLFDQALQLRKAGKWQEAEERYRKILEQDPSFADAWNALGVLAQQAGDYEVSLSNRI